MQGESLGLVYNLWQHTNAELKGQTSGWWQAVFHVMSLSPTRTSVSMLLAVINREQVLPLHSFRLT